MATKKKLLEAAAGSAGGAGGLNVEDVFSTYLYKGTDSTQTITNGIDLDGEGGLVWLKSRGFTNTNTNLTGSHALIDTERGNTSRLLSNTTDAAQSDGSNYVNSFNSDGFTVGTTMSNGFDGGHRYTSWTFRKAPKFFDVQTFTTTYNNNPNVISHNLESDLGCAIFKQLNSTGQGYNWIVWHRSLGLNKYLILNGTNSQTSDTNSIKAVDNSAGTISFGYPMSNVADRLVSGSTETTSWVGYFFAHNNGDGNFGPTGDQDIIKCGSFTTNSSSTASVNLGWEPQWVIIKPSSGAGQWFIIDSMRGLIVDNNDKILKADATSAEANGQALDPTPTGFNVLGGGIYASTTYIYIAIRRGPMAVPESATEVFDVNTYANNGNSNIYNTGFNADMNINKNATSSDGFYVIDRLRGAPFLLTNSTVAETGGTDTFWNSGNNLLDLKSSWWLTTSGVVSWSWRRAPSFFDVVAYTGNSGTHNVSHNLGAVPEMMIVKNRDTSNYNWFIYHKDLGNTTSQALTTAAAYSPNTTIWDSTTPTDSVFTLGNNANVNNSGNTYIAYLFASLAGVSKVGSYTGNGTSLNIDCGFSSGARFVLIKGSSFTHDWHVFDTERGIVAGNDPFLELNTTNAENSSYDALDPYSAGFTINQTSVANLNANGASYIFYAIA